MFQPPDISTFVKTAFEHMGAVCEPEYQTLQVLMPYELQEYLGLPDDVIHIQCSHTPGQPGHVLYAGLGSEIFTKLSNRVCESNPLTKVWIEDLSLPSVASRIKDAFQTLRVRLQLLKEENIIGGVAVFLFRTTVLTHSREENIYPIPVEIKSGCYLPELLEKVAFMELRNFSSEEKHPAPEEEPSCDLDYLIGQAKSYLQPQFSVRLNRIKEGLRRKYNIEWQRINRYYSEMQENISQRLKRQNLANKTIERLKSQLEAVELDKQSHLKELKLTLKINVCIEPVGLLNLYYPSTRVLCQIERKKTKQIIGIDWNPVIKDFIPLKCSKCGSYTKKFSMTEAGKITCLQCS